MKTGTFILFLIASVSSCKKNDKQEIPGCIKDHINAFSQSSSCSSANVKEYSFQDKNVFVFDPGTCGADMTSEVKDEKCNTLGHLGGIAGNTKINGEDFSKARLIKEIWKK